MSTDMETVQHADGSTTLYLEDFAKESDPERGWEILRCRVGSVAYGCNVDESDEDEKSIYVQPKRQVIGTENANKTKRYSPDSQAYSLRHFVTLGARCVPNVLELLFCDHQHVLGETEEGEFLRKHRYLFLSRKCIDTYLGYAESQLLKAQKKPQHRGKGRTEIIEKFGYDTKFAYHTIRLLQTAEELLSTGLLNVLRPNPAFLIRVRYGEEFPKYEDFRDYARNLAEKVREAADKTTLLSEPPWDSIHEMTCTLHEMYWANHAGQ